MLNNQINKSKWGWNALAADVNKLWRHDVNKSSKLTGGWVWSICCCSRKSHLIALNGPLQGGGGGKWHIEIWSPKIQLDLKLPNLPTFHFTWWGVGGSGTLKSEVQKSKLTWNFQICQLFILQSGGWREVAPWNLKSKNPNWLETFKSANFSFYRVGVGAEVALWNLKWKKSNLT